MQEEVEMFQLNENLDQQNRPWKCSLFLGSLLQLWIIPLGHKIGHEYLHKSRNWKKDKYENQNKKPTVMGELIF